MIQPIKKVSISDQVFFQMKQLIIEREWLPGSKLPSEGELSTMFEVSRVTVRNALHKLSALELIETQLGDGSYVRQIDEGMSLNSLIPVAYLETNVSSVLEFRREIESGTCAITAQKATEEDVKELRKALEKMLFLQNDLEALSVADQQFHYMIAKFSRNNLILKTYEIINDIYTAHMQDLVKSMGGEIGVYYHEKIVDAIEAHDSIKAREYMFKHITKNQEFIETGKATLV